MKKIIFFILLIFCFTSWASPPIALGLGLLLALTIEHPYLAWNKKITTILLQVSVVGLGFGINLSEALLAGKSGLVFTMISISGTLLLGYWVGKYLKVDSKLSYLISCGTAICGGSAIAAVSSVVGTSDDQASMALGTVFILNAASLFIFPNLGEVLHLSQSSFGLWAAIAIHDTSSVVGAASRYGGEALEIATTVKLMRALWIIPLVFMTAFVFRGNAQAKVKLPYFIFFFILAILLNTYLQPIALASPYLVMIAKRGLTVTLFLIGAGLSRKLLKNLGLRPFLQGLVLWIVISAISLLLLKEHIVIQ